MDAIRIHEYGDPSRLILDQISMPEPKAGEVRVKVEATGLNYIETYQRQGLYPNPLPFTPGAEFAGLVDIVGEGVTDFKPGDRVATASGSGGYAEYATAPADRLVALPAEISCRQAAAVLLQGMTAHYLTLSTYPLEPGVTALVHAAAGGVGQLLVQFARFCSAKVIATVSTDEKSLIAQELGADHVINYSNQDFENEVMRLTDGVGVDVIYDGVGRTTFLKGLNCLKKRGMMVLYGQASGPVDPINPQILNQKGSLFLTRPSLGHYLLNRAEFNWRTDELFKLMVSDQLRVRIDKSFPLRDASRAHEYIQARSTRGKVLLIP
jgi:NADPH2:quinone reductase